MSHATDAQQKTVLIVEDEKEMLGLLSRVLCREGYEVMEAGSASAALDLAAKARPALVVLDLVLPDCDGVELLARLRAMIEGVEVIVITGYGSQDRARDCMEYGAFDFLTKPFGVDDLRAAVQQALESGSYVGAAAEDGSER